MIIFSKNSTEAPNASFQVLYVRVLIRGIDRGMKLDF